MLVAEDLKIINNSQDECICTVNTHTHSITSHKRWLRVCFCINATLDELAFLCRVDLNKIDSLCRINASEREHPKSNV